MRRMLLIAVLINILSIFSCYAQQDIAVIQQEGKYGLIDNRGTILSPCIYDYLEVSCSDLILCKQGAKYGFIDRTGHDMISFEYDSAGVFYNDTAYVMKGDKVGFINRDGVLFIGCQYESVDFFSEGLATVKQNGKWGLIDHTGTYLLAPEYDFVFSYKKGYSVVVKDGKQSLWSKDLLFIEPLWNYDYLDQLYGFGQTFIGDKLRDERRSYLCRVIDNKLTHIIDSHYISIISMPSPLILDSDCSPELRFDYTLFHDTLGLRGIFNPSFDEIITGYQKIAYLSPYHFLCTKKDGYYAPLDKHIYDSTGFLLGDFSEYDDFGRYTNDRLLACKNSKWGMIDFQKNTLLPFKYEELTPFKKGVAMARIRNNYYLIDERGKKISKALSVDKLSNDFYEYLIITQKGGKYGAIDYRGKEVLSTEYDNRITFYPLSIFVDDFK